MNKEKLKQQKKQRRKARVRFKIKGTSDKPRLSVFKSNKGMYLQVIDDEKENTLVSVSSKELENKKNELENFAKNNRKVNLAYNMGILLAKKILEKNIKQVVFDKSGYKYHGRVKAVADGVRKQGVKI